MAGWDTGVWSGGVEYPEFGQSSDAGARIWSGVE